MINLPMSLDGKDARVGASIGIALYAKEVMSPQDLLKNADEAMYRAKAAGKNTFRFSDGLA
jgi:diguanylate cyclase (GGDEF)-like protein